MRRPLWGRLSRHMTRLWVLAALCVGAILAIGAPAASAATEVECSPITGSGSSLQNIVVKEVYAFNWEKTGFKEIFGKGSEESECSKKTTVTYTATSSGKGLAEWGASTKKIELKEAGNGKEELDAFVGTDVGPEGPAATPGTQIANMDEAGEEKVAKTKNGVVAIPIAKSAISVIVSLPVGCHVTNVSVQPSISKNTILAEEWDANTKTFLELVAGLTTSSACDGTPGLQARETASGTTAGFKRYLNDIEPSVYGTFTSTAVKSESASEWPNLSNKKETGNSTGGKLAEKVIGAPGLVGYADLADARAAGFTTTPTLHKNGAGEEYLVFIASVPNGGAAETKGESVNPEGTEGAANCEAAKFEEPAEIGVNVDWSKATETNATLGEKGVYPICTLTFDVLWSKPEFLGYSSGILHTLHSFFEWLLRNLSTVESSVHSKHFDIIEKGTVLESLFLVIFPKV